MNDPFAATLSASPPLSCSTTVPDRPDTLPPTVYDVVPPPPLPVPAPPDQLSAVELLLFAMMPGAPPVKLLSVTDRRCTPFCSNETLLPAASSCSCVPAASAPELYTPPSCVQAPPLRLKIISSGLP